VEESDECTSCVDSGSVARGRDGTLEGVCRGRLSFPTAVSFNRDTQ